MRSQDIGDITEIDAGDKLLRGHIGEQFPERLALNFGPEIPDRVDHCCGGQVNSSLLWSDPAQLTVASDIPPEGAHIGGERLQSVSDNERGQRPDGGDENLVSTSDSKGHAMPFQASGMVGLQNHVCCGIIRVVIHVIGAIQGPRLRKTNIICLDTNNSERHNTSPSSGFLVEAGLASASSRRGDALAGERRGRRKACLYVPTRRRFNSSDRQKTPLDYSGSSKYTIFCIQNTAYGPENQELCFRIDAIVHTGQEGQLQAALSVRRLHGIEY